MTKEEFIKLLNRLKIDLNIIASKTLNDTAKKTLTQVKAEEVEKINVTVDSTDFTETTRYIKAQLKLIIEGGELNKDQQKHLFKYYFAFSGIFVNADEWEVILSYLPHHPEGVFEDSERKNLVKIPENSVILHEYISDNSAIKSYHSFKLEKYKPLKVTRRSPFQSPGLSLFARESDTDQSGQNLQNNIGQKSQGNKFGTHTSSFSNILKKTNSVKDDEEWQEFIEEINEILANLTTYLKNFKPNQHISSYIARLNYFSGQLNQSDNLDSLSWLLDKLANGLEEILIKVPFNLNTKKKLITDFYVKITNTTPNWSTIDLDLLENADKIFALQSKADCTYFKKISQEAPFDNPFKPDSQKIECHKIYPFFIEPAKAYNPSVKGLCANVLQNFQNGQKQQQEQQEQQDKKYINQKNDCDLSPQDDLSSNGTMTVGSKAENSISKHPASRECKFMPQLG